MLFLASCKHSDILIANMRQQVYGARAENLENANNPLCSRDYKSDCLLYISCEAFVRARTANRHRILTRLHDALSIVNDSLNCLRHSLF